MSDIIKKQKEFLILAIRDAKSKENERINKIYLSENFKTSEKEKLHQRFEQERQDDQVFMNYRFKIYIYI